jgi:hypothetical protein
MIGGGGTSVATCVCGHCGESFPIKSNQAVAEEVERLAAYLVPPPDPGCPNQTCVEGVQNFV